jgi:3-hydroxybutyryl-CoA dehydrogenase
MQTAEPVPAAGMARVAIIGAGQAGRKFARRCARAGFRVVLEDVMPARLRQAEMELAELASGVEFAATVEDAVREAEIVLDFVPDELESKLEIFCLIDRMAPPGTIVCSPIETLSITDLASCTYRGERCLGVRGDLMGESVRLLYPESADRAVVARVQAFFEALGCAVGVELDPDVPMLVKNAVVV